MRRLGLTLALLATLVVGPAAAQDTGARAPAPRPAAPTLTLLQKALRAAAAKIQPAVVSIEVSRVAEIRRGGNQQQQQTPSFFQQMFREFAQRAGRRTHPRYFARPQGPASGVLISADGLVATSWYNIGGKIDGIRVRLNDGRTKLATLVGWDRYRDLAVLKVDGVKDLPHLTPVKTDDVRIGQFAVIVSRGANPQRTGMNWGIVSATGRFGGSSLQIDARTNYASSGSPVIDIRGRMIGIVSQVNHWERSGQNSGVGYAADGTTLVELLPDLAKGKKIEAPERPFLGIQGQDHDKGVEIARVVDGSSAAGAGLKVGDVITKFNGGQIQTMTALVVVINRCAVGQTVQIEILRGGKPMVLKIKLGQRKD